MRDARITAVDRASLVVWPVAWALLYYALTLSAVWGTEVRPIQAMFLMFGMMITGLIAVAAAGIWLGLLTRRERRVSASTLTLRELTTFGAVSGAVPMAAFVGLYELRFVDTLGALVMLGLVASAGVAGALSSIGTSGIVALRNRHHSRGNPPARTGMT
jgi:hypothetical protein